MQLYSMTWYLMSFLGHSVLYRFSNHFSLLFFSFVVGLSCCISRISDQNGISRLCTFVEINLSGRKPLICPSLCSREDYVWIENTGPQMHRFKHGTPLIPLLRYTILVKNPRFIQLFAVGKTVFGSKRQVHRCRDSSIVPLWFIVMSNLEGEAKVLWMRIAHIIMCSPEHFPGMFHEYFPKTSS